MATVASSLGGVFGALLGFYLGRPVLEYFSSQKRIDQVAGLFHRYGGWAVALAALTPIPYKVFTIAAGVFRVRLCPVLLWPDAGYGFFWKPWRFLGDEATSFISNYLGPATFGLAVLLILAALLRSRYHRRTR